MIRFCTHFASLSYRYFFDPLIDIDISQRLPIDRYRYFQNCLIDINFDIDIFQNCLIDIDIDIYIFKNDHIDIDIDIDIFQKCRYIDNRYSISIYRTGLNLSNCYPMIARYSSHLGHSQCSSANIVTLPNSVL